MRDFPSSRRLKLVALAVTGSALLAAVVGSGLAGATVGTPEFTLARDHAMVWNFDGFGGQFNQHVYADISGPPPDLAGLEAKVLALQPRFVRVFFNTTEWTYPDRMASFVKTVQLAQRAQAQINITWQGSSFDFAMANMSRFADVLAGLLEDGRIDSLWVTLFNEPNSTQLTLPHYEQVYRLLDAELRQRGVRDRVRFMGGDLVGTTSPLGQSQAQWFGYMADHMGDLLDAWSVHVYWNFWDPAKIDRRLSTEVRTIVNAVPPNERRPVYVTEFGVRGLPNFEGEPSLDPGLWPDGTPVAATKAAAFQEAWFMIRAAELGYSATAKWDLYWAKYAAGELDYSAIGPASDGWPLRPVYHLLQLLTWTTAPEGGSIVAVDPSAGADPSKLLTAYVSPAGNITILGLDTAGGIVPTISHAPVAYSIGGLPPNTLFRLLFWNGDGSGKNLEIGFLDSGPTGVLEFSVPLDAVFALTNTPLGALGW